MEVKEPKARNDKPYSRYSRVGGNPERTRIPCASPIYVLLLSVSLPHIRYRYEKPT